MRKKVFINEKFNFREFVALFGFNYELCFANYSDVTSLTSEISKLQDPSIVIDAPSEVKTALKDQWNVEFKTMEDFLYLKYQNFDMVFCLLDKALVNKDVSLDMDVKKRSIYDERKENVHYNKGILTIVNAKYYYEYKGFVEFYKLEGLKKLILVNDAENTITCEGEGWFIRPVETLISTMGYGKSITYSGDKYLEIRLTIKFNNDDDKNEILAKISEL